MTDAEAYDLAVAVVKRDAGTQLPPIIDDADVETIVAECKAARTWVAETAYEVGDVVVPSNRNGRRYIAILRGTSGTTEPIWLTRDFALVGSGTATFQEAGAQWPNVYDTRLATYRVLRLKMLRAAHWTDGTIEGVSINRTAVYRQLEEQARRYKPARVA